MRRIFLSAFFITLLFSQNLYWGAELELHGNIVSDPVAERKYDARASLEYALFVQGDLTYDIQWKIRFSAGEKVAREPSSGNDYFDWRFFYYSLSPQLEYEVTNDYFLIAGASFSFINEGTYIIVAPDSDIRVPVQINPNNVDQKLNDTVTRLQVGVGKRFFFRSLIVSPRIMYYHGFDNALEDNEFYDFTFSSFSFNVAISF